MLADSAEAVVRVLEDRTPERVREAIELLVAQKLASGQLDDAPLTPARSRPDQAGVRPRDVGHLPQAHRVSPCQRRHHAGIPNGRACSEVVVSGRRLPLPPGAGSPGGRGACSRASDAKGLRLGHLPRPRRDAAAQRASTRAGTSPPTSSAFALTEPGSGALMGDVYVCRLGRRARGAGPAHSAARGADPPGRARHAARARPRPSRGRGAAPARPCGADRSATWRRSRDRHAAALHRAPRGGGAHALGRLARPRGRVGRRSATRARRRALHRDRGPAPSPVICTWRTWRSWCSPAPPPGGAVAWWARSPAGGLIRLALAVGLVWVLGDLLPRLLAAVAPELTAPGAARAAAATLAPFRPLLRLAAWADAKARGRGSPTRTTPATPAPPSGTCCSASSRWPTPRWRR